MFTAHENKQTPGQAPVVVDDVQMSREAEHHLLPLYGL